MKRYIKQFKEKVKPIPLLNAIKFLKKLFYNMVYDFILDKNNTINVLKSLRIEENNNYYIEIKIRKPILKYTYTNLHHIFFKWLLSSDYKEENIDNEKVINLLNKKFNKIGYFVKFFKFGNNIDGLTIIKIILEPNIGEKQIVPKFLYHLSKTENEKFILSKGLKPKEGLRKYTKYPSRVYLFNSLLSKDDIISFSISLFEPKNDINVTLFKVDTQLLNKNIKFYIDKDIENSNIGVWTYSHIPENAISVYKRYNIKI